MAIAQFSDDARTEFKLNSYDNKESLLEAIQKISYKGGNTKTGRLISPVSLCCVHDVIHCNYLFFLSECMLCCFQSNNVVKSLYLG